MERNEAQRGQHGAKNGTILGIFTVSDNSHSMCFGVLSTRNWNPLGPTPERNTLSVVGVPIGLQFRLASAPWWQILDSARCSMEMANSREYTVHEIIEHTENTKNNTMFRLTKT